MRKLILILAALLIAAPATAQKRLPLTGNIKADLTNAAVQGATRACSRPEHGNCHQAYRVYACTASCANFHCTH